MESMESGSSYNIQTGLTAWGYVKLAARTVLASFTATLLIILFVFGDQIPLGWLMFLNPEVQILFLYILGIMFLSNILAALAISV